MSDMAKDNPFGILFSTIDFACRKHKNQRRKDPEETPYINHPLGNEKYNLIAETCSRPDWIECIIKGFNWFLCSSGVANTIVNEGGVSDIEILQAAVLHDTVEDTNTSFEELEHNFGKKVS